MTRQRKKPMIHHTEAVAQSRLFTIEAVDLEFSNGETRRYERIRSSGREAVMIVPVIDNHLLLIEEYMVGLESYELGFPKGLIDPGEDAFQAANRELKEEAGFGARWLEALSKLTMAPSWFSGRMHIVLAQDLYAEKLPGDEPEPLLVRHWPLNNLLALLNEPGFRETRNISALFLAREWLVKKGRIPH